MNHPKSNSRVPWAYPCTDIPNDETGPAGRTAVIVMHGMGQPVPFQTLESLVIAIREAEIRAGGTSPEAGVRRVELGVDGKPEPFNRVELTLGVDPADPKAKGHGVHLYEAYWAPIPEGRVSAGDVVLFLLRAALQNIRYSWEGVFSRFLFGRMQEFHIQRMRTFLMIFTVALLIVALVAINAIIGLVSIVSLITQGGGPWLTSALTSALLGDVFVLFLGGAVIAAGVWIIPRLSSGRQSRSDPSQPSLTPSSVFGWIGIGLGGALVLSSAWLMVRHILGLDLPKALRPLTHDEVVQFSLVWLALILLTRLVRDLLVQYVGDVAAYVSAHTVNRFWHVRSEIYQTTMRVARAVYGAVDAGVEPLYSKVVIVGHSLGSLIAYDTLNGMLLEDQLARARGGSPLEVTKRTAALVTSGSPLDKTAYLFRIQRPMEAILREVLANAIQPLIRDPAARTCWINIYSWNDVISGKLDFYDPPAPNRETHLFRVENLFDHDARTPLLAHNEYWTNPLFGDQLLRVLKPFSPAGVGQEPDETDVRAHNSVVMRGECPN